jgi:hypothetical protein
MSDLAFNFVCPAGGGDLTGTTYCFDVKDKKSKAKPETEAEPDHDGAEPVEVQQPTLG